MTHSFANGRYDAMPYRSLSKLKFSAEGLSRIDALTQSRSAR